MKPHILTRLTETINKKLRRLEESNTGEQFRKKKEKKSKVAEKEMVEALAKRVISKRKFSLIAVYNVDEAKEEEGKQKKKKGTGGKALKPRHVFHFVFHILYLYISHIFIHTFSYLKNH